MPMRRAGDQRYGFFDLPEHWVNFVDPQTAGLEHIMQFSDPGGQNIITVTFFPGAAGQITSEDILNATAAYMLSIGGENLTGVDTYLGEIEAQAVFATFPHDGTAMFVWAFESEGQNLHQISAEGPMVRVGDLIGSVVETVAFLEESFALDS